VALISELKFAPRAKRVVAERSRFQSRGATSHAGPLREQHIDVPQLHDNLDPLANGDGQLAPLTALARQLIGLAATGGSPVGIVAC
jgi:hypothetical protein